MTKALKWFAILAVGVCVAAGAAWAQEKPVPPAGQEKDKVTGEVGSQQGATPISEGSFVDGKLTITFTYVDGNVVVMSGALADGQLTGSLSYGGGQMVTNWAAKKRPAK